MKCKHAAIYTTADKIGVKCLNSSIAGTGGSKRITCDMVCQSCDQYEPVGFWPTMRYWVAHPLKLVGIS